jgi:hypothetical protein
VRVFLDSRLGRHFADEVANGLWKGEALESAIEGAITRWMGWRIAHAVCLRPVPADEARSDLPGRMPLERVVAWSWNARSDVHGFGGRITVVRAVGA